MTASKQTFNHPFEAPSLVQNLALAARELGGRALIVGGAVRDHILGEAPKDFDLEVYGVPEAVMPFLLSSPVVNGGVAGSIHTLRTGRSFPVWKAWRASEGQNEAIDVALPRREVLVGNSHTAFQVQLDESMSFEDASSRRDYTINAIGLDPLSGEILDPHGGVRDLESRTLRHVSDHFREDPLRVLRGMQFIARFGLTAAPETVEMCRSLTPEHLSRERIFGEFDKLVLKVVQPGKGLHFLREVGWLKYFPELDAMVGVPQDAEHHPEGDAFVHTAHVMDAFARLRTGNEQDDRTLGFAALCHDLGKPSTTQFLEGRWRSYGHEEAGEDPTRAFLGRMTAESALIDDVVGLVANHMRPKLAYKQVARDGRSADKAVRRIACRTRIDLLANLVRADNGGRPPRSPDAPEADWLVEAAARLDVASNKPKPLVQGRDLIAAGMMAGPEFGPALRAVYERQLDGEISSPEQALAAAIEIMRPTMRSSAEMFADLRRDLENGQTITPS